MKEKKPNVNALFILMENNSGSKTEFLANNHIMKTITILKSVKEK